jgi:hypothetical protein
MASSYTDLGLELMVTGENSGTWGDKTNTNLQLSSTRFCRISRSIYCRRSPGTTSFSNYRRYCYLMDEMQLLKFTGTITGNHSCNHT